MTANQVHVFNIQTDDGQILLHSPKCYNCGENIDQWTGFLYQFEPGEINYPHEPDTPEEHYLICGKCAKKWMEGIKR